MLKTTPELLNRFLIRVLRDLPPLEEPVTASGQMSGNEVEVIARPIGWTSSTLRVASDHLSPCERAIIDVIKQANKPLIGYGIWGALNARGKRYSLSTVYKALARLTADRLLTNDRDKTGYLIGPRSQTFTTR